MTKVRDPKSGQFTASPQAEATGPAPAVSAVPPPGEIEPSHPILPTVPGGHPLPSDVVPLPGMELVGRGVVIRPNQTYDLKPSLVEIRQKHVFHSNETGRTFWYPEGYEVNDSPPMPAGQLLNQTVIEESWERFEKQTSIDANLAASHLPITIDVSAGQATHLRTQDDAYYAMRTSFIPLWSLYLPNARSIRDPSEGWDIPTPFSHRHRRAYADFFDTYGTHYVKRAWIGGKATLALTVTKSANMSKEDIKAGLHASYGGFGSAGVDAERNKQRERLATNSECSVYGKGGDELQLAALSSLDEDQYLAWLSTIKANPQVIEFEAIGIWTLVADAERADALMEAYREETAFSPLKVAFRAGNDIFLLGERNFFTYGLDDGEVSLPRSIKEAWPGLEELDFERVDAGFVGKYMNSHEGEDLSRKLYFFNRDRYLRWDLETMSVDDGYPRLVSEGWPGVTFERIDAVVNVGPDALYFFCGREYIRFNTLTNRADEGYPEQIARRWAGVTFDRIDAAAYWGNAKVLFFRGDQVIRYDTVLYQADPGYPKTIPSNYVQDWKFIE